MNLLFETITIVLPVFLVIALGTLLFRLKLFDANFLQQTNRLVFVVFLPLLLFHKIGKADFNSFFNGPLVLGSSLVIVLGFLLAYIYSGLRGYPMGFLVPVLNLLAILALLLPQERLGQEKKPNWLTQVLLNPLIIASFFGLIWSYWQLPIPLIVDRALNITSGVTLPLALLAIGGGFSVQRLKGDLLLAGLASGIKLAVLPFLAFCLLLPLGVTGPDLGIGILMAGTPAATATYIMAHQLKADAELAGSIVMVSTLASAISYTVLLLLLKGAGL